MKYQEINLENMAHSFIDRCVLNREVFNDEHLTGWPDKSLDISYLFWYVFLDILFCNTFRDYMQSKPDFHVS